MSKRNKSFSSNSSDKDVDVLEEEFLKLSLDDIPVPKEGTENYEPEIQEIMKSGCNRQIAEYSMLNYKEIEDNDKDSPKLYDLRKDYNDCKKNVIEKTISDIKKYVESGKLDIDNLKIDEDGYENEIDEILGSDELRPIIEENDKNFNNMEKYAKFFLKRNINNEFDDEEKRKDFEDKRKKYYVKREAVIEAALRKIKKIVNDKNEYKIFYKDYYGKDLKEEEENNK